MTPDEPIGRREALRLVLTAVAVAGCGDGAPATSTPLCVERELAIPGGYCLLEGRVLRVLGGRRLVSGQATLLNVDDRTAVVVARDESGWFALSAICTHQCCLLSLCANAACAESEPNPGDCRATAPAAASLMGAALVCPCHASTFRLDGTVINGPATRPLPHFALRLVGDDALIDTSMLVGSASRAL